MTLWRPLNEWKPIRDELVKETLEILLDVRNHPMLLIDPYVISWSFDDGFASLAERVLDWVYTRLDVWLVL